MASNRWILALFLAFGPLSGAQNTDYPCQDLLPECQNMKDYCNRTHYFILMTQKCALTCERCNYNIPSIYFTSACRDNINMDCGRYASYCQKPRYIPLMTKHCPFTCKICLGGKINPTPQ